LGIVDEMIFEAENVVVFRELFWRYSGDVGRVVVGEERWGVKYWRQDRLLPWNLGTLEPWNRGTLEEANGAVALRGE
jgi:hypothetical protein